MADSWKVDRRLLEHLCDVSRLQLTEEELEGLYRGGKLMVLPLRFGAGVKGKVIEALINESESNDTGSEAIIDRLADILLYRST